MSGRLGRAAAAMLLAALLVSCGGSGDQPDAGGVVG